MCAHVADGLGRRNQFSIPPVYGIGLRLLRRTSTRTQNSVRLVDERSGSVTKEKRWRRKTTFSHHNGNWLRTRAEPRFWRMKRDKGATAWPVFLTHPVIIDASSMDIIIERWEDAPPIRFHQKKRRKVMSELDCSSVTTQASPLRVICDPLRCNSVWDRNEWFLLIAIPTRPLRILLNQHRGNNSAGLGRHLGIERELLLLLLGLTQQAEGLVCL